VRNEVAECKHLEDVARSIDKINGSVDMGLKEGVKLSTLIIGAHIGNLGNKGDKVESVEMCGTMSTCITGVSSAINIRVVKTTLKVSETPQRA
jgi:ribulose kinase